jgi:hypothetical protein
VFRQPEIVAGTWKAARAHADDITEADACAALQQLDPLWDELFPAEQARIVALLVERVDKRFHYENHDQLRTHLADFMAAYNFARRLKTLGGLTPYEYICKVWTSEPDRFILDPIHQMPGLNT